MKYQNLGSRTFLTKYEIELGEKKKTFNEIVKDVCRPEEYQTFHFEIVNKIMNIEGTTEKFRKLQVMKEYGINVNAFCFNENSEYHGLTPLQVAVLTSVVSSYVVLLKLGARLDLESLEGGNIIGSYHF